MLYHHVRTTAVRKHPTREQRAESRADSRDQTADRREQRAIKGCEAALSDGGLNNEADITHDVVRLRDLQESHS